MGLIRDAIGSALGSNQVNNGFGGGPRLPLVNKERGNPLPSGRRQSPSHSQEYGAYANANNQNLPDDMHARMRRPPGAGGPLYDVGAQFSRQGYSAVGSFSDRGYQSIDRRIAPDQIQQRFNGYHDQDPQPPRYEYSAPSPPSWNQEQPYSQRSCNDLGNTRDMGYSRNGVFRPLILPQIAYGDGQPFLRGYSNELVQYGISFEEFIRVLDAINVAIIPSPENQIFQKGANIAGWFLPGAAGIGLTVGQLGVGIGSAVGHASILSRALSDANIKLFVPNGLEICVGKTTDVDAEVGIASASSGRSNSSYGLLPEERQARYGDLVAPLSQALPPLQQSGRSDPIAMLGRGLASRDSQKKMQKAEKNIAEGKTKKVDSLEGGLKWLMVRRASADALAYWEKTLEQSNTAIEQGRARTSSRTGYS